MAFGELARHGRDRPADAAHRRLRRSDPDAAARRSGVIPLCLNVQRGAVDEFKSAIPAYEEKVAELAEAGVDVINPSGAPPFMVLGYEQGAGADPSMGRQVQHPDLHLRHQPHRRAARARRQALHRRDLFSRRHQPHLRQIFRRCRIRLPRHGRAWTSTSTRRRSCRACEVYRFVKKRVSRASARPRRSTCSGRAGARSTSSRCWNRISACRSSMPSRRSAGTSSGISHVRQPVNGFGRLIAEMPPRHDHVDA